MAVRHEFAAYSLYGDEQRELVLGLLVLVGLVVVGTLGYMLIEGWSWTEGLYMTFITLTTIGFGEVRPLSDTGRFFTVIVALAGIGLVAFIATRSVQLLLIGDRIRELQMLRRIAVMTDHYLICGYGRIGRRLTQDFRLHTKRPFLVIERNPDVCRELAEAGIDYLCGDAEEEDVLVRAGIERAHSLILALPEDSANVFITLIARELSPDLFILTRTSDPRNQKRMRAAGADKVVAPNDVGADRMAQVILRPHVDLLLEKILRTGPLGLNMVELTVEAGAPLEGQSLASANFRQTFDVIVIAVIDARTHDVNFNPDPQRRFLPQDVLLVLGGPDMLERLREEGCRAPS
ncbi:MAG: potassium channel protein [Bacteroidota bacterium]